MSGGTEAAKAALRVSTLARRDALTEGEREAAARRLAAHALPVDTAGRVVAAYWPIRSEIDPRPLLAALPAPQAIALPAVEDGRLVFRRHGDPEQLVRGGFGVYAPPQSAPLIVPDILLVPLAAFDRRGGRLGYGRGYYDAYLAARRQRGERPPAIGLAFACQEAAAVPLEAHDQRLDWILTEREAIPAVPG
ncbi:MAG: 5-formyltetrahydrofolate cyclo-ligase [Bauldia sp.]